MVKNDKELDKSLTLLVKGSIIVLIGVFLSKLLTYIYKIVIARSFGPENYGLFSLALIIATLFSTVASLGLSEGILRYTSLYSKSENLKKVKPLLKFSIAFSCTSGILFGFILFIFSNLISIKIFNDPSLVIYLKYFSIGIPIILISNLFLSIIKANMQIIRYTFILNILQNTIRIIGLFIFIFLGLKSHAIIGSYLLGIISILIGSYIGARIYILKIINQKDIGPPYKRSLKKEFIAYSWPIIFVGFIGTVLYWIDSLVIGYLIDTTSVGIYAVAFTIVSLLSIAPELFMQMFLPVIIKEYSDNNLDVITQISKQVSKWIGLINIPIFTLIVVFPETIITLLFGEQYLGATESLQILAISGFLSSFSGINTSLLSMKGKSKSILVTLFIASIINLILNFLLVSSYGINGAAMATTFIWFINLIAFSIQTYKFTGIFAFRRKLALLLGLSLIPGLILFIFAKYFKDSLTGIVIGVLAYCLVYLILVMLSKSLDKNDYTLIKKIIIYLKSKGFKGQTQNPI